MKKLQILFLALVLGLCLAAFGMSEEADTSAWSLLKKLVLIPGVSEHESRVADAVKS